MECFRQSTASRGTSPLMGGNSHIPGIRRSFWGLRRRRTFSPRRASNSDVDFRTLASGGVLETRIIPRDAHNLLIGHAPHDGTPGTQTMAPSSIIAWLKSPGSFESRSLLAA